MPINQQVTWKRLIKMNTIEMIDTNGDLLVKSEINGNKRLSRVRLSDIIGNFGRFQFYVTLFSALREVVVAFDVVVMSSLLSKVHKLNPNCCELLKTNHTNSNTLNETSTELAAYRNCVAINDRNSLISEWKMQCNQSTDWYIALIETSYLVGFIPGNLILGYCSDRFGRTRTYLISHVVALIGGVASIFVTNYWLFVVARFVTATGSCGFNIIYTISLELVGIKFRALNTLVNHFGWGLGVLLIPFIDHMFSSRYQYVLAFCPVVSLLMLLWALFLLRESPLWLMTNAEYTKGRQVLEHISRFNHINQADKLLKKNIDLFELQMREDRADADDQHEKNTESDMKGSDLSIYHTQQKHRVLFANPTLRRDTIILAYSGFVAALFYYILAMNFSYVQNLTPEANFISTGAGEWIGVVICIILLKCLSRRLCFQISFLFLAGSFIFQCYLDYFKLDDTLLVTLTNATGSIFTCSLIFLIVMVSMEVLPTNLRNTGGSIIDTTTHCGSAMAPLFIQIGRIIGNDKTDLIFATLSLIGALAIQFLTKTDHIELSDV